MNSLDPRYKSVALNLAHQAGEIILKYFKLGIATEWKEDSTPVTVADKAVNDLVVQTIREKFPEHGIIASNGILHDRLVRIIKESGALDADRSSS